MNKNELLQKLFNEIQGLQQKADRTPEETALVKAKLAEAQALKDSIQEDNEVASAMKDLNGFINEPASGSALAMTKTAKVDGIDGEVTLNNGQVVDIAGFALSDKQKKAICEPTYKGAWLRFATGKEDIADLKVLQEGIDELGGYLVPPQMINRIIARKPHPTRFLEMVNTVPTTSDTVKMPRLNYTADDIYDNPMRIAWTGENGPMSDAADPLWGEVTIPVHTGTFAIEYSRDFAEDTPLALDSVITRLAKTSYNLGLEHIHLLGNGASKPLGLLTTAGVADGIDIVNIGSTVGAAMLPGILNAIYALPEQYSDECQVFTNRTTFGQISAVTDSTGNLINLFGMDDRNEGMTAAKKPMLQGYPVYRSPFISNPGSNNIIGLFGDIQEAYTRVQRIILSVEPYGQGDKEMTRLNRRGLSFRFREGGKTVQPRAAQAWRQA